ncbi:hypothetical protein CP8484711_0507B, partial [Chlamydia psittaci 84-8471/1]
HALRGFIGIEINRTV